MHVLIIPFAATIHRVRGTRARWLAYLLPVIIAGLGFVGRAPLVPVLAFAVAYAFRWNLPHGPYFTLGKGPANNRAGPALFDWIKQAFPNDYWGSIAVLLIMDIPFLAAGIIAGRPLAGLLTMLGSTGTYVFWFTLPLHDRGIDPTRYAEWTGGAIYGAFFLSLMGLW
ncbi:MAG: hypothetical protein COA84_12815 [Robiginitomaculum sp.]|nr:MAG: hypothetical protein COA84_12815 [Robiginitomaculum sp.]